MKKWKIWCSLGLVAAALVGTLLSGCAQSVDYTQEIREYQEKLESLSAENEELRSQLGLSDETRTAEGETESEMLPETEAASISDNQAAETAASESAAIEGEALEQGASAAGTEETAEDDVMQILVFGDSIWDSTRDDTGVAAKIEAYMEKAGQKAKVYNAAIGGTRATLDPGEDPYTFYPASEWSLPKMVYLLTGQGDVEWLQGKAAYEELKAALAVKDQLDMIILSYGMNDFLSQVPLNASAEAGSWTGYGTSLREEIKEIRSALPNAQIMVCGPSFGYYFPNGVVNMGDLGLFNYAKVAGDVVELENVLGIDPYNTLGMDPYNEERYLEDGVHLTEEGRDLYSRGVVNCLLYGKPGTVSGNAIEF